MTLQTKRLSVLEASHVMPTMFGPMRCVCANAWMRTDRFPSLLVASLLLVEVGRKNRRWLLSHILVEDESRRQGFATELLEFYEDRLGTVDACFASESGVGFAKSYIDKHGPRDTWRIVPTEESEALLAMVREMR
jgi:GNAT superfamily N-acetyltransferase